MLEVRITREQNKMVRNLVKDQCAAYKNWIVTQYEAGNMERVTQLIKELRAYEAMYHIFIPDEMI